MKDEAFILDTASKLGLSAVYDASRDKYSSWREKVLTFARLMAQPEQEPVAWMVYTQEGQSAFVTDNPAQIHPSQRALPLYATPQRTWIGLTDDEVYRIALELEGEHWRKIADAIEAKLKEKNT